MFRRRGRERACWCVRKGAGARLLVREDGEGALDARRAPSPQKKGGNALTVVGSRAAPAAEVQPLPLPPGTRFRFSAGRRGMRVDHSRKIPKCRRPLHALRTPQRSPLFFAPTREMAALYGDDRKHDAPSASLGSLLCARRCPLSSHRQRAVCRRLFTPRPAVPRLHSAPSLTLGPPPRSP